MKYKVSFHRISRFQDTKVAVMQGTSTAKGQRARAVVQDMKGPVERKNTYKG